MDDSEFHMLTFSMLGVPAVTTTYKTTFFSVGEFWFYREIHWPTAVYSRNTIYSIIIGCWNIHWSVHFLFQLVHTFVDNSICIVCQMLSWWTKNRLHSISFWDNVTKMVLLCSVYRAPSYESNLTLLAPFPAELAYLSMLFILEMVCMQCRPFQE